MTVLRIILCLLELDIDRAASLFCLVLPTHILYSSFLAKHEESDSEFGAPRSTLIAFKDVLTRKK